MALMVSSNSLVFTGGVSLGGRPVGDNLPGLGGLLVISGLGAG